MAIAGIENRENSLAEANKKFFDDMASKPPEWQDRVFGQIIREIRNSLDWIGVDWVNTTADVGNAAKGGEVVRLLDYACGTGTVSQALSSYITTTVGIDLSPKSLEHFNAFFRKSSSNTQHSLPEAKAYVGELLSSTPSILPSQPRAEDGAEQDSNTEVPHPSTLKDFDIAAVGMALHHFPDPALGVQKLADRVKKGGVLYILDFETEEGEGEWSVGHHAHGHGGHDHHSEHYAHGHHHSDSHGHTGSARRSKDANQGHSDQDESSRKPGGFMDRASKTITSHSFTEGQVKKMFADAGLVDFKWKVLEDKLSMEFPEIGKINRTMFLARGLKA